MRERSGEFSLESSAFQAIDTDLTSFWATPPGDLTQWVVVELPARTRITRAGVAFQSSIPASAPVEIRFESSLDGLAFEPLGVLRLEASPARQMVDVEGREAAFVRATVSGSRGGTSTGSVASLQAEGEELEAWSARAVEGRWRINNLTADLRQNGNRFSGVVAMDPPMILDGGWDGRLGRFIWTRGPQFGYGVVAVNPAGRRLSGAFWHEKAIQLFLSASWFGERIGDATAEQPEPGAVDHFLDRFGRAPLYGLAFEGDEVDEERSASVLAYLAARTASGRGHLRLVAYELREPSADANMVRSKKRIESLRGVLERRGLAGRFELQAMGSDDPDAPVDNAMQRSIYSRVDLVAGGAP